MDQLRIGRAAQRAGVGVETIRFYQRKGLIDRPPKPSSGFRLYTPEGIDRIRFIRKAQELGFSLREIQELLSLETDPRAKCEDVRARASAKLTEIDGKIENLVAIRLALKKLISACPRVGMAAKRCTILEALRLPPKKRRSERR